MPCDSCSHPPKRTRRSILESISRWSATWILLTILQTAIVVAVLHNDSLQSCQFTDEDSSLEKKHFSPRTEYMTLAATYDHLWNETGTSGLVNLPYLNGTDHVGIVTMYVLD